MCFAQRKLNTCYSQLLIDSQLLLSLLLPRLLLQLLRVKLRLSTHLSATLSWDSLAETHHKSHITRATFHSNQDFEYPHAFSLQKIPSYLYYSGGNKIVKICFRIIVEKSFLLPLNSTKIQVQKERNSCTLTEFLEFLDWSESIKILALNKITCFGDFLIQHITF